MTHVQPPLLDEIHEELKREDRIRRLKQWLPGMVAIALITLGAAAGYSWHHHNQEKWRVRHERYYAQAITSMNKGESDKARAMLRQLVSESPALRMLALSTLAKMDMKICLDKNKAPSSTITQARTMLAQTMHLAISSTTSKAYREWVAFMGLMLDAATNRPYRGPVTIASTPLSIESWQKTPKDNVYPPLSKADILNVKGVYEGREWSRSWRTLDMIRHLSSDTKNAVDAWAWWSSALPTTPNKMEMSDYVFLGSRPDLGGDQP